MGFEPTIFGTTIRRVNQLRYTHHMKFSFFSPAELARQEGLEPPTCGFGDRRSTNWSYWPIYCLILASFLMQSVMSTPFAIFFELNTIGIILLVLLGRVVAALALSARKSN